VAGFESNDDIIGKQISFWGKERPVIGVVKDFNTTSLSRPIDPVMLFNDIGSYQSISLKLSPSEMQKTIEQVKNKWEAAYPEFIFSYDFLDEQIRNMYRSERQTSIVLSVFSSIAIFICCLGLFGLVAFMANQKTKEIGVRKVVGASAGNIMFLFSMQFVKLILLSFLLAAPPVWFLMTMFLKEFAYKIKLGPAIFLTGLAVTFLIAMLTVGFRSCRASLANPVRSLRSE
jgi:ABC-type antimicrobial peptide transport system permease subunit